VDDGYRAIRLLRKHGILSIADYIIGLEEATLRTIMKDAGGLHRYDSDFVNALYITPHAWTPMGRQLYGKQIIEKDLGKWDYRHQVIAAKGLSPAQLLVAVKCVEALYHLHPRRLWRLASGSEPHVRRHLRRAYRQISKVFWVEILEHLLPRLVEKRRGTTFGDRSSLRDLATTNSETRQTRIRPRA
jgi:anaerobic magnesium-protoporphyrin IX monomethyl ester cyclase